MQDNELRQILMCHKVFFLPPPPPPPLSQITMVEKENEVSGSKVQSTVQKQLTCH